MGIFSVFFAFLGKIPAKVWGFLAIMLLIGTALWWYGNREFDKGAAEVQDQWDADKRQRDEATADLKAKHAEETDKALKQYQKQLMKYKRNFDNEKKQINDRAVELAGERLRLPDSVCNRSAAAAKTEGSQGSDDAVAGTVALPKQVEGNLRQLMAEADTVAAGCRIGQQFIEENGFEEEQ